MAVLRDNANDYKEKINLSDMQPCARCEEELPADAFEAPDTPFCKRCMQEAMEIARKKYGIIGAAHWRAQLRHKTKNIRIKPYSSP
jgi:hypothetical protein